MRCQPSYSASTHSDSESGDDNDAQEYRSLPHFRRRASSFFGHHSRPTDEPVQQEPHRGERENRGEDEPRHTGLFSRRAREASRSSRSRAQSLSALDSPHVAGQDTLNPAFDAPEAFAGIESRPATPSSLHSPDEPDTPFRLFAPTFSQRQLVRLSRSSKHVQAQEKRQEKKERGGSDTRAELKVAMGVLELVESQRKEAKRGRGRGVSRERSSTGGGAQGAVEEVLDEVKTKGIFGAFAAVEEQVEQVRHRASEAGEPARPLSSTPSAPIVHGAAGFTPDEHKRLAEIGGAAALAGVFSAGMALYEHEKEVKKKRSSSQAASKRESLWAHSSRSQDAN